MTPSNVQEMLIKIRNSCWVSDTFRFQMNCDAFWREAPPMHNPIINQRRRMKLLASRMSVQETQTNMHPSSNRTCFIRIGGICLLMLLSAQSIGLHVNFQCYIKM